jgi:hypothetical protein
VAVSTNDHSHTRCHSRVGGNPEDQSTRNNTDLDYYAEIYSWIPAYAGMTSIENQHYALILLSQNYQQLLRKLDYGEEFLGSEAHNVRSVRFGT